ncbi:hypothetical protein RMCBS344292_14027 [Rhizopus microsporus]|nr:hypothetical protein RMCBS344292_14027 [Rhizopus microsporus]
MYAASWFPSLFTNSPLPITQMKRLYDLVFLEGAVETALRFSLCLMQRNEKMILSMNQADQVLAFIQSSEFFACYPHDAALFYQDMMQLNSTVQHQITQTADLARTVAQLQKENTQLKMQGMEQEAAQLKLSKRNAVLEKRVKKYKKKKDNFNSFVESLRDTGDFGALIAGAIMTDTRLPSLLTVNNNNHSSSDEEDEDEHARKHQEQVDAALQNVTSELVAIKIDHFETTQRYEALYRHCEHLSRQLQQALEHQTTMMQKIIYLTSELEDTTSERDQLYQDQEQVLEMATVAKKTAAELQLEKMTLAKEVELLEQRVAELEKEKQQFFMPRDTFSEEVFAAHSILFGQQEQQKITQKEQRRHTMAIASLSQQENEYKTKYVESELRCRELEKYLAEAKVRLAELETSLLYPVRRASSVHLKRSSTASILARVSTPTTEPRASTESYASSTTSLTSMNSSQYNSKRSSMYSRIWNAFGNSPITPPPMTATTVPPTTTTTVMKNSIICQEPQII